MNIAILLGVSEYQNADNLPACKEDLRIMGNLVNSAEKFDDVLYISGESNSAEVKEKITNYIKNLKGKKIDEIFFYYTGHGDFYKNEFYYLLSDFDEEKRKQTCLENSELDNWFRSLKPDIIVKVVDACNSGVMYVKEEGGFEKYLEKSKGEFNKCYFMFSSNLDQFSYQDKNFLSDFTKSFLKALEEHETDEIRYKDLIDYISDDFENNSDQTPFFVVQAEFTEQFCSISSKIREIIGLVDKPVKTEENLESEIESKNLVQTIQKDAEKYFTEEDVLNTLEEMKDKIVEYNYSKEFLDLYDIKYSFERHSISIPRLDLIGKWIDRYNEEFFADVLTEEEEYEVKVPEYKTWGAYVNDMKYGTETRYKRRITGFRLNVDCPYKFIRIEARPKFPNIPWSICTITFILSKTEIVIFHFYANCEERNWKHRDISDDVNWNGQRIQLKNKESLFEFISNIQDEFEEFIVTPLKDKFDVIEEDD